MTTSTDYKNEPEYQEYLKNFGDFTGVHTLIAIETWDEEYHRESKDYLIKTLNLDPDKEILSSAGVPPESGIEKEYHSRFFLGERVVPTALIDILKASFRGRGSVIFLNTVHRDLDAEIDTMVLKSQGFTKDNQSKIHTVSVSGQSLIWQLCEHSDHLTVPKKIIHPFAMDELCDLECEVWEELSETIFRDNEPLEKFPLFKHVLVNA